MPFSLRTLQRYFLIGSNTILNIFTPLAIVDRVATYFNVNEGTDEHRQLTRLAIVGLYAALTLGMEYRSARRMTDEVMPEQRQQPGGQAGNENERNSESGHNSAIGFAGWSRTIGQGINTAMVVAKLGGGTTAGTLVGLGLGSGGYFHARHPGTQPSDIIHQSYYPGQLTYDWRGLMSALLLVGAAASAIDNASRYINAYKIVAYEMVDIFEDPATQPFIDTEVLFLTVVCLLLTTTMYSKFLLARNRSAAIYERHASAVDWREWFRRLDKRALLGAAAHSVLAYCNDRSLTQDVLPEWLSLLGSILLPSLGFIGTYATNANYERLVEKSALSPAYQALLSPPRARAASWQSGKEHSPLFEKIDVERKGKAATTAQPPVKDRRFSSTSGPSTVGALQRRRPSPVSTVTYDPTLTFPISMGEGTRIEAAADQQATRDLLSFRAGSNGELSGNHSFPSPPLTPTPPAVQSGRTTGSWLRDISKEPAVGQPNASLPQQPVGATTPLLPAARPLSPLPQSPPATTKAKTGRGGWFSFWSKSEQPALSEFAVKQSNVNPPSSLVPAQVGFVSQVGQWLRFLVSREEPISSAPDADSDKPVNNSP